MERMNPSSGSKSSTCTGEEEPPSSFPLPYFSPWKCKSPLIELEDNTKSVKDSDCSHCCPSDTISMEGQLSWLDDLLNEPEVVHRGHRRSASDTCAYIGGAAKAFDTWEEPNNQNDETSNASIWAQKIVNVKASDEAKPEAKLKKDSNAAVSASVERHETDSEESPEGTSSSQAKPSVSKPDTKRSKQQSAHRSRVRKLQYIAHLERTVQILQATGTKMSAELEFLDHQNVILNMENRALKQRLDSVSQEQLIKQFEHEMLEREFGRLQDMCRLQEQEQEQMRMQQQNPKHRRTKSKDGSTFRGPLNGPVQI